MVLSPPWARPGRALLAAVLVCTALVVAAGYLQKTLCTGAPYDAHGRSAAQYADRAGRDVCYSDVQSLWTRRGLYAHRLPYVDGGLGADGQPTGGSVEYPVLTGVAMWLTALPAHDDAQYLAVNAVVAGAAALAIAVLLAAMAGRRVWWWALAPPLAWYAVANWDLLVVTSVVAAVAVVARWRGSTRAVLVAAALLGVGGALKLYPLMFLLPLALAAFYADRGGERAARRSALNVLALGAGVFVAANLPFAVAGPRGWWAAYEFQWSRPITSSTQSIWWLLLHLLPHPYAGSTQQALAVVVALATAVGLAGPVLLGVRAARRSGAYPWLPVSAAMLCGYLLLNKVDSPQYALWLLPFLVLLPVPRALVLSYVAADAALWFGWFRSGSAHDGGQRDPVAVALSTSGLVGRAVVLVLLSVAFLRLLTDSDESPLDALRLRKVRAGLPAAASWYADPVRILRSRTRGPA